MCIKCNPSITNSLTDNDRKVVMRALICKFLNAFANMNKCKKLNDGSLTVFLAFSFH